MTASLKQQITTAFQGVGETSLTPTILSQISALSTSLRLSPKQLAEAWEAHSLTKNVDTLSDASFKGYQATLTKQDKTVMSNNNTGLGKRSAPGSNVTPSPAVKREKVDTTATPGANGAAVGSNRNGLSAVDNLTTPKGSPNSKQGAPTPNTSSTMVITPPNNKPVVTVKYSERKNSGHTVSSYNPHNLPSASEIILTTKTPTEKQIIQSHIAASISLHPASTHPTSSHRHMFTPLEKRSGALEQRLHSMNNVICNTYNIKSEEDEMIEAMDNPSSSKEPEIKNENGEEGGKKEEEFSLWTPVGLPKQSKVVCVGRICNEAHEGRLNRASIRLEGSRQHSAGSRISVDLQELSKNEDDPTKNQSYSFFPGQIVAIEGINSSGRTMQASRLIEGAAPPTETLSASQLMDYHHGAKSQNGNPLSIVSLCGPFTTKDNLDYDPLVDAILKIQTDKPDVVIMCGPFVDSRQPLVTGNDGVGPMIDVDGTERAVSYEFLFANKISALLEEMYMNDPELKTQFVLVPSMDDAFLDNVYPQPPLQDRIANVKVPKGLEAEFGDLGLNYVELAGREKDRAARESFQRVHCVSNPCTLQINDVTVGVTSTDVLFHISSDECNANLAPGTRLSRIAQHLIQQRSYYPLFPAPKGMASLDLARSTQWEMPVQPDILITPSKLASFARKVSDSTIVVNPGELTKNTTGGTYAEIDIHPMKRETLENGMEANMEEMGKGVHDRVRVDIKRI